MINQTEFEALRLRLGKTLPDFARYLGVATNTARHWCDGSRDPGAVARRLVHVLGMVEALAPELHEQLTPERPEPIKRGRPLTQNAPFQGTSPLSG